MNVKNGETAAEYPYSLSSWRLGGEICLMIYLLYTCLYTC